MKYTEQDLKDEYEQAVKRRGKLYADGYVEGLKDAQNQALTLTDVSGSFSQNDMENFAAKCMILGSNSKDIKELLKGFCDNDH